MLDAFDAEHEIVHHDNDARFQKDSKDICIIRTLATEDPKPVFLTSDLNMRTKYPHERKALAGSRLTIVFFRKTFHNVPFHNQAVKLLNAWPSIVEHTSSCTEPTVFDVSPQGKVHRYAFTKDL